MTDALTIAIARDIRTMNDAICEERILDIDEAARFLRRRFGIDY